MKSSCSRLKVYDFNEEDDELTEMSSAKYITRYQKNPNAVDKYSFLETFARGTKLRSENIGDAPCVDVDAVYNDHDSDGHALPYTSLDEAADFGKKVVSGLGDVPKSNSTSCEQDHPLGDSTIQPGSSETRASTIGTASPEKSQLNYTKSQSEDESVDTISDADDGMDGGSPSTASDIVDDSVSSDGLSSNHGHSNWDMGDRNMEVSLSPDFIIYCDKYYTECELVFSNEGITMKGSTANRNQGTFSLQWGLDDVSDIETIWFGRHETALVKICIKLKDEVQATKGDDTSGTEELKFSVADSNWYERQDEIMSLDMRYNTLWNIMYGADLGSDGEALVGRSMKSYFPNFDEPFEEVVYPKGDSDPVSISKRDVDLLQPETFVNDTIIDFYIKYLKNKIKPEERHRFHFFNSFFFRKLADLDKDRSSASQGKAAFQRVRKWTRKVNLFEKDYVFIPVNFNYHWSLIVICHPGEVAKFQDDPVKSAKVPCILHMDSIKGSHSGLKDLVQSYLWEEWKEKQKESSEEISSRFLNLRFVPLELPQQQNSYDCGLFLLHYVELFLDEAPLNFSPFEITKFSNFLNINWFPPADASLKRVVIQRLIYQLLENHSPENENSPAAHEEIHFRSNFPESINRNETSIEFPSERRRPKSCDRNMLFSEGGDGIAMTLLPSSSSLRSAPCASDSGLVVRELFGPRVTPGSFLDGRYQGFDRSASFNEFKTAMSAMEAEEAGGGAHLVYASSSTVEGFNQMATTTTRIITSTEACPFSYTTRDVGHEETWKQDISVDHHQARGHDEEEEEEDTTSVYAASSCSEESVEEVEVLEMNNNISLDVDFKTEEELDQRARSPSSKEEADNDCLTEIIACCDAPIMVMDVSDSRLHNNNNASGAYKSDRPLDGDFGKSRNYDDGDDEEEADDDMQQQARKRIRLTLSCDEEEQVKLKAAASKDLHL